MNKEWKGIDTNKCFIYSFELAEMEFKYPGLLNKLKSKYTKLSDFKFDKDE